MMLRTYKKLKNISLIIGAVIVLLYLVLSLIESSAKLFALIVLTPIIIWMLIAIKHEREAAIMANLTGVIIIIWFIIDYTILRYERLWWHIPVFILIAPLPAFAIGYILWKCAERISRKNTKRCRR